MEKNIITKSVGAKRMAEILANTNKDEAKKARKRADRMSRETRQEALSALGIKVIVPVTAKASAKFSEAEILRKETEAAIKAVKAAERAEREAEEAALKAVEERQEAENEAFVKSAMALAMAKALAAKA